MKTFNDYSGAEGIDKLVECAPYVSELIKDKEMLSSISGKSWIEVGAIAYKAHTKACDKLFEILDHKPENSVGLVSATAQIMVEILTNKDMLDFFGSASKRVQSSTSVTEITEAEQ